VTYTFGSLFSGAGGMDAGFEQAGFAPAWHSEIDKDAVSVLRRHWPGVPQLGDVTQIHGGRIQPVDVIQGGSPCQGLSQAGARKGLKDDRSGLFFDFVRIVGEMRDATDGRYPAVVVLENVDGLLSSHRGRDFAVVLSRLQELGAAVSYRVLDAQFHGVPQRRRRVFVVADFAPIGVGEERAAQILALGESLCGHPEAGDPTRQGAPAAAEGGAFSSGEPLAISENQRAELRLTPYVRSMSNGGGKPGQGYPAILDPIIVAAWDEAQITRAANRSRVENGSPCPTLNGSGVMSVVIVPEGASTIQASAGHSSPCGDGSDNLVAEAYAPEVAATLSAGSHASHIPGRRREDDTNLVALAFNWQAGDGGNDTSFRGKSRQYICRAGDYAGALGVTRQDAVAVGVHLTQDPISSEDAMPAIGAGNATGSSSLGVFERDGRQWIVRRLTPTEGERLMGWPDSWTRYRDDGTEISDSARWRLIGNGVVSNVAEWIARRLYAALEASS
jgi:DNA (cytosine-5)-methyltransferase 1